MSIPKKYSQESELERGWEARRAAGSPKSGRRAGYNDKAYRSGYEGIEWKRKRSE